MNRTSVAPRFIPRRPRHLTRDFVALPAERCPRRGHLRASVWPSWLR